MSGWSPCKRSPTLAEPAPLQASSRKAAAVLPGRKVAAACNDCIATSSTEHEKSCGVVLRAGVYRF
ncbi:hypothetical protein [Burkholderia multivorans]|uniref:hypothetical protein n=1 Tax=Burkholderia multivorans TaxID=87883 RepID=UPI0020196DE6|nr:hypothetical protein [Burkholderia multivorans]MCL4648901.1 hypothetical protein [Burkholderia multivorans]MCL4657757.1 hypothetical protein [Burkholderia multivorans]MCO1423683.1 hypothetical protein [Burkholderia multivorans]UQN55742.1 hypothetical protein L0Y88_19810 [Burkholderia multivorans]UQN81230.1 hypothetical protein L0Z18_04310 [Burkholderia multivorans]